MPLDPQAQTILDLVAAAGVVELTPDTDPQTVRDLFERLTLPSTIAIEQVEDRTVPGPAGPIPVRVYRPAGDAPQPVVVFFHGGGWVIGSLHTHDGICRALADALGCVVVSVDYRLAPEHPFPAAVDDAFAATRWVQEHAAELGGDPRRVAIAGDSAGGHLAAVSAIQARDAEIPLAFQLLVYPAVEHEFDRPSMHENAEGYFVTTADMRWFYGHFLADGSQASDWRVSPIHAPDLAGLPPALVITAQYDPLRDQGRAYAEALRAAGNEVEERCYDGVFHGFFSMQSLLDVAKVALDDAVAAMRPRLAAT